MNEVLSAAPTGVTPATATRRGLSPGWAKALLAALLSLAAVVSVGVHVAAHPQLSPLDEYVYIDYVSKVPQQLVVRPGEEVGSYARQELGCRGLRVLAPSPDERCDIRKVEDDGAFPLGGKTTADGYSPLYFAATWLVAQPLLFFGVPTLTDAARLAGSVWLALAMVVFFLALVRLKVPHVLAAGAGLLVIASPATYWSNSYVSTDATALLAGAVALYGIALHRDRPRLALLGLLVATPIFVLLKLQNVLPFAAVAVFMLATAVGSAIRNESAGLGRFRAMVSDSRLWFAIAIPAVAAAAQIGWMLLRSHLVLEDGPDQGIASPLTGAELARVIFVFLNGAGTTLMHELGARGIFIGNIVQWFALGGVMAVFLLFPWRTAGWRVALAAIACSALGAIALAFGVVVVGGHYFSLPERYGLSLLPVFLALAALAAARNRAWHWLFSLFFLVLYLLSLSYPGGVTP